MSVCFNGRDTFCPESNNYLLSPWSRALLEKLTGSQLVKKLLAFYGNRKLIAAFKKPAICPCSEPDQSSPCPPNYFLKIHLNIILLSTPGFSKWSLSLRFLHQTLYKYLSQYELHISAIEFLSI
jgi:hypothetical protein